MKKALDHFKTADPKFAAVVAKIKLARHKPHGNHFRDLVESILSQQLAVKASDTIIARVVALFPGKGFPTPQDILKVRTTALRKAGVSGQKASYLKDLASHVFKNKIDFAKMAKQSDEEVIAELVAVKGIGRWTAEMFLMFSLGRPDVFSPGDLGLRNAIKKIYGLRKDPTPKQLEKLSAAWSPHRTTASRYLWASLRI